MLRITAAPRRKVGDRGRWLSPEVPRAGPGDLWLENRRYDLKMLWRVWLPLSKIIWNAWMPSPLAASLIALQQQ